MKRDGMNEKRERRRREGEGEEGRRGMRGREWKGRDLDLVVGLWEDHLGIVCHEAV